MSIELTPSNFEFCVDDNGDYKVGPVICDTDIPAYSDIVNSDTYGWSKIIGLLVNYLCLQ